MGINMNTVASSIEKNKAIPASLFVVPKGISVKYNRQADEMSREMSRSMITSMKDPDAVQKFEQNMAQSRMQTQQEQAQQDQDEDMQQEEIPEQQEMDEMMQQGKKALQGLFR